MCLGITGHYHMLFDLHSYQTTAFISKAQIIILTSGIQGGKTTVGALWAGQSAFEIKDKTPHNIIIVAPTYKILSQATLPKFFSIYGNFGVYKKMDSIFIFKSGVTVYIRSLTDPNSVEGITEVKRIWLDEGGLISKYAWENVMGRAVFKKAQIMVTTTPYALNWLYTIWQDWKEGRRADIEFIQFRSIDNPYFPKEEYLRQKRILDPRRFTMKYDGIFGKMEGLVYENVSFIDAISLPAGTKYYGGVDWGYTDPFVLVVRAVTPDNYHYRIAEFYKTELSSGQIIEVLKARQSLFNIELFVCDPSRPDYIQELNMHGLAAIGGNNSIRLGIDKHIELIRENRFFIFKDENPYGNDEYNTYHYPEDKEL